MDWSSWFRRALLKDPQAPQISDSSKKKQKKIEGDLELYGVTQQLIDRIKTFTVDTFKDFHLREVDDGSGVADSETATTSGNVRKDLSEWQERHASLVLSTVKEMSQLRYMLCPRYMKEREFWRTYFVLVKSDVAEYELRSVRLEKLKKMETEDEKSSKGSGWEVEMSEAK
ncbi:uncharacterized protein LOC116189258 [Punica granatum]|uniref:BSD domain-containing protein n=2 Tax=Punica granatum TaxID=22663 RepID=A0A218XDL1_PUNGR|nr:uncharacterized protein LOC116189258 [Punica granatum]OWM82888.1 hypothetical protein CDL15_Pgr005288 [Punica granatum]PKI64804.1 hypothetical protein CRG98_014800 [Punica granatum]